MGETKHTRGAWLTVGTKVSYMTRIISAGIGNINPVIATVYTPVRGPRIDECKSNAALIAAAPEMLTALQTVMSNPFFIEHGTMYCVFCGCSFMNPERDYLGNRICPNEECKSVVARAAIAKAQAKTK